MGCVVVFVSCVRWFFVEGVFVCLLVWGLIPCYVVDPPFFELLDSLASLAMLAFLAGSGNKTPPPQLMSNHCLLLAAAPPIIRTLPPPPPPDAPPPFQFNADMLPPQGQSGTSHRPFFPAPFRRAPTFVNFSFKVVLKMQPTTLHSPQFRCMSLRSTC